MSATFLERWLEEVIASPGATAIKDVAKARRVLVDDALRAAPLVDRESGPVIDVGSGGGTPGIPLATTLSDRAFTLLEAERRKCDFLERVSAGLTNVAVVWGRAEEQQTDVFGVALAKALAKPPVAAELCLPLVRPGGIAIVWVGHSAETRSVEAVAERLASALEDDGGGLLVLRKLAPTPPGFPRRPGMAKKRPLA
ncbi:MAG: 16S rRNA (guanine(527)-N(7))-methyltransferase RsmG [Gaiellaceae bacterium]